MAQSFRIRAVMHAAAVAGTCMVISAASAQDKYATQIQPGTVDPDVRGAGMPTPRGEPDINCTIGAASCQQFEFPRVAGTSQLAIGTTPIADQFKTASGAPAPITNLCWWGTYGTTCAAFPASPLVDDFQVAYYANSAGNVPGALIASFRQSAGTLVVTRRSICDVNARSSGEFTGTHAPVPVTGDTCYFIEIRNFTQIVPPATTAPNWFWSRTFAGAQADGYCLRDADNNGYQFPAELLNDDRAWCIGTSLNIFGTPDCYVGGPPPPICGNPASNGQARAGINGGGFSNDGPGAVGLQLGDSVQFATSGPITNMCFWGFWVAPDGSQPTGPGTPDFDFAIMDSDGPDGLPNTVLLSGRAGTTAGFVARRQGTDYNMSFPSLNVVAHHCYYVSLAFPQDNADPNHAFRFAWGLAANNSISNNEIVSRPGNTGGAWSFFNFGTDPAFPSNMSWVFDRAAEIPGCGLPPPPPPPPSNDNCASATAISGTGTFNYDNRGATTDGTATCDNTSGKDVWFDWTSPCAGNFTISMCPPLSSTDSILSALDGGCAGVELACDDDGCGAVGGPSIIDVSAAAGQHLFIRIAEFANGTGQIGQFSIGRDGGPCPAQCPCDFNHDGVLNSQDFFDFLACFFNILCPNADFNHDGVTNSQDFFDFLACFFNRPAGC